MLKANTQPQAIESAPSARFSRWIFAASLAAHGTVVWAFHASAAEPVRPQVQKIEIEFAPPPPEPEPEPEKPEPEVAPPPQEVPPVPRPERKAPLPRPLAAAPSEPVATDQPIGSDFPSGDEGNLPPAPAGVPAPGPLVEAPPAPPPPPPPPPVIEAREGANYLNNPRPSYPRRALEAGWEGRVLLKVKVLPNGHVGGAVVQKSAGRSALDEAALEVVKGWLFVPATQGGRPVAGWVSVPFEFRIQ